MKKVRYILMMLVLCACTLSVVIYRYFTDDPDTPYILLTRTANALAIVSSSPIVNNTPNASEVVITNTVVMSSATPAILDADGDGIADADDLCPNPVIGAFESDAFGCPTIFDPFDSRLTFSDDLHIARYQPFWTGDCGVLTQLDRVICDVALTIFRERVPGAPSSQWVEVSVYVLRNLPPDEQGPLRLRLWDMGRRAFQNWSDEACRTIATGELIQLGEMLREINGSDQVDEITTVVDDITGQLSEALARQSPC